MDQIAATTGESLPAALILAIGEGVKQPVSDNMIVAIKRRNESFMVLLNKAEITGTPPTYISCGVMKQLGRDGDWVGWLDGHDARDEAP